MVAASMLVIGRALRFGIRLLGSFHVHVFKIQKLSIPLRNLQSDISARYVGVSDAVLFEI